MDTLTLGVWVVPTFWMAILLVLMLAVWLRRRACVRVRQHGSEDAVGHGKALLMPVVALGLRHNRRAVPIPSPRHAGSLSNISMSRQRWQRDSQRLRVLYRHVLPNALLPSLTRPRDTVRSPHRRGRGDRENLCMARNRRTSAGVDRPSGFQRHDCMRTGDRRRPTCVFSTSNRNRLWASRPAGTSIVRAVLGTPRLVLGLIVLAPILRRGGGSEPDRYSPAKFYFRSALREARVCNFYFGTDELGRDIFQSRRLRCSS